MLGLPARRLARSLFAALAAVALGAAVSAHPLHAQFVGRIAGHVLDSTSRTGLPGVSIQVVGTTSEVQTSVDGRYVLQDVRAGTVTIFLRRVGFEPKTITGILLDSGKTAIVDVVMTQIAAQLSTTVSMGVAEVGTVTRALDEQRASNSVVNSTTSEQISRSPDGDAGQATKRISSVTLNPKGQPEVRGLDPRYTRTALNGSTLPSPDPETKAVPLDLIPSALLQSISVTKTFTPDLPADFSGANIDIALRQFPGQQTYTLSVGGAINQAGIGTDVLHAPGTGNEWLGFAASQRALPNAIAAAGNLGGLRAGAETNSLINAFRNSWSPTSSHAMPNTSLNLSAGGETAIGALPLGYIASVAYSHSSDLHLDEHSTVPRADGHGGADTLNAFTGATGQQSTLWGALLNTTTWIGTHTRLNFDNAYTRSADNEAQQLTGFAEESATDVTKTRLTYVERSVRSHQLSGEHALDDHNKFNWHLSTSAVSRVEPDRADNVYWLEQGQMRWKGGPNNASRSFADLYEHDFSGAFDYHYSFGSAARPVSLRSGVHYRTVHRSSSTRSYDILNQSLEPNDRQLSPEELFGGAFTTGATPNFLLSLSTLGGTYTADDDVSAAYAMGEFPLGDHVRMVTGARVERADLSVESITAQGQSFPSAQRHTDLLPALSFTIPVGESNQLRLAASRTLSRPEYRELSPIAYLDLNGDEVRGNADLRRALIENYDARWEWYVGAGEVVSAGLFAKRFHDPIERVYRSTTGLPTVGYSNAESATNIGLELDARKNLGVLGAFFEPFTLAGNVSLVHSKIRVTDSLNAATNAERAMVGQAPYVGNASLAYANNDGKVSATVLYNIVGRRISLAGVGGIPDTYETARHALDLAVQFPVRGDVRAKVGAKNLLDSRYREQTAGLERHSYRTGRVFSFALTWQPPL